jgi:tetratricopeptide (TPR) repeat protein
VPTGWLDIAELINPEKRWYKHSYRDEATGSVQTAAPVGTHSYCEMLLADTVTADMVGKPTIFFSHAWLYRFQNVVAALRSFVDSLPHDSPTQFFWFDCFSIDEHATQTMPQEWWGTTFREAISLIGHTVMMLSPWNTPVPLTRAWCLWELYCSIITGAAFSVCLGPAERLEFEVALLRNTDVVVAALSNIDVSQAEAGSEADRVMILNAAESAPGGTARQNEVAIGELRKWMKGILQGMAASSAMTPPSLAAYEEDAITKIANAMWTLGEFAEACALRQSVVDARAARVGPMSLQILGMQENLAVSLAQEGNTAEAKRLYALAIDGYTLALGATDLETLRPMLNLGIQLRKEGDTASARPLFQKVIDGRAQQLGPHHLETLMAEFNMADLLTIEGHLDEAQETYERVVSGIAAELGDKHAHTLTIKTNLASLHRKRGDNATATTLFTEIAAGLAQSMGAEHVHTLNAKLGLLEIQIERSEGLGFARESLNTISASLEAQVGIEHTISVYCQALMALLHEKQGNLVCAETILKQVLISQIKIHGTQHVETQKTIFKLQQLLGPEKEDQLHAIVQATTSAQQNESITEECSLQLDHENRDLKLAAFFANPSKGAQLNSASVDGLTTMGFGKSNVIAALEACDGSQEDALDLLLDEGPSMPSIEQMQRALDSGQPSVDGAMMEALAALASLPQATTLQPEPELEEPQPEPSFKRTV